MAAENSLFCLNTQCAAEVKVHETDPQQDEEVSLNADQILTLICQELNNRCKEIKRKLNELGMDVTGCIETRSNRSMDGIIDFKDDEKVMERIRREGSRLEVILMNGILKIENLEASHEKVSLWLQKYEEYSASETLGYGTEQMNPGEHPQSPEESDNTSEMLDENVPCL
ncbi:hypothetical protein Q8A67_006389 [Cirrhinus molitorella]|uniref:Uncharacterized protein n=1 Tax=Cirrhinus molitorella TaxID=172907 RepID=A0AA88TUM5_9TELE|nr:hypothetical protein Q8A67_006389 [Cirrhinus molitorella]